MPIGSVLVMLLRSRWLYVVIGVILGGIIGSGIGIAGFGGAIAGTVPLALIGGYLGYRLGVPLQRVPTVLRTHRD